jgi:glycosyltransferase involved in cell wall biosynthesis
MQPLVSIIIPCYNTAQFIAETIQSVITQTYVNWQCVIVNDGSTDNTEDVIKTLIAGDDRFAFYAQPNSGPSVARNLAISTAAGEYILPLDGDDKISPNYVEECVKALSSSNQIKLVYGAGVKFGLKNETWKLKPYSWETLLFGNCIHCSGMYRKVDWQAAGGYDVTMRDGLEDWEFWISLLNMDARVVMLNNVTFYWRIKEVSRTTLLNQGTKVALANRYVYCKHAGLYDAYFIDPLKLYNDYTAAEAIASFANHNSFRFFLSRQWKKLRAKKK